MIAKCLNKIKSDSLWCDIENITAIVHDEFADFEMKMKVDDDIRVWYFISFIVKIHLNCNLKNNNCCPESMSSAKYEASSIMLESLSLSEYLIIGKLSIIRYCYLGILLAPTNVFSPMKR